MLRPFHLVLLALCTPGLPLQAHEFWIEPTDYAVEAGGPVTATFRNGEEFAGSALSYIPGRSALFEMIVEGERQAVPARIGDNPAFDVADLPEGLLTILHETTDRTVTYKEWAKWVKFTDHKDFAFAQQEHLDRGLPETGFEESYRRFAKALIAVGGGAGADAARGLRTEIVAGANPYVGDLSAGLPVQVLLDGAPKGGAQVEMFAKDPEGNVEITLHTADGEGRVTLPVEPGHEYLLDSVTILPLDPVEDGDPVWQTLWAALTFAVPPA
ncbi:DUF4198 domain-containing protein [Jannaschia marina]|uniref:DUF4198 domain-containing protein n=1 Tax=Jannaschia marina TaxID=2741674 RepID=UPI0015C83F7B|nr:DUF4198 domain-containing protein [Jannaschia marina]